MGRPKAPPAYHDEVDRADTASMASAISLHENIVDGSDDEDAGGLPPYIDDETATAPLLGTNIHPDGQVRNPAPADLDEQIESWIHNDWKGSTYTRLSPTLTTDPVALREYIKFESAQVPQAFIRIAGNHTETRRDGGKNGSKKENVTDFDFQINVTQTIYAPPGRGWNKLEIVPNSKKTYRGTRLKMKSKHFKADVEATHATASLDEWCHLFCASSSAMKGFTLRRTIMNRNEQCLQDQIVSTLRGANYRGHITVTFPLHHRSVTIMSPHPFNRLRNNKFFYWFCIIFQLWIITWPILFFSTRRWAVVDAEWFYKQPHGTWIGEPGGDSGYILVSESEWSRRWRYTIQRAATTKMAGGTEIQHTDEARSTSVPQAGVIEGALSFMRGVSDIVQERDSASGWGYDR